MDKTPIQGSPGGQSLRTGMVKPGVKKQVSKSEPLLGRSVSVSAENGVSRARKSEPVPAEKASVKKQSKLAERSFVHKGQEKDKGLRAVEEDILDLGVFTLEDLLKAQGVQEKEPSDFKALSNLGPKEAHQKWKDMASFENAGGLEVFDQIVDHYDKIAHDARYSDEQRQFFASVRDEYVHTKMSFKMRKMALEEVCLKKVKGFNPSAIGVVDQQRVDFLAKRLIGRMDKIIWDKKGYCVYSKEKFSKAFSGELFATYVITPQERGDESRSTPYIKPNGEQGLITETMRKDLTRSDCVLIDENGNKVEWTTQSIPHLSEEDKQALREEARNNGKTDVEIENLLIKKELELEEKWAEDKIDKLLAFCGNDKNKLFKLSQCMNQSMGVDFLNVAASSESSPQHIGDQRFRARDSDGKIESYYHLQKDANGDITIKFVNNLISIGTVWVWDEKSSDFPQTDPDQTYYRYETGMILGGDDNALSEYQDGYLEFNIVRK